MPPLAVAETVLVPATVELSVPVATPDPFVGPVGCVNEFPSPVAESTTLAPLIGAPLSSFTVTVIVDEPPLVLRWDRTDSNGHSVAGGIYIGVGPDQSFSYIAHVRPSVAYIIDVRRDNMLRDCGGTILTMKYAADRYACAR